MSEVKDTCVQRYGVRDCMCPRCTAERAAGYERVDAIVPIAEVTDQITEDKLRAMGFEATAWQGQWRLSCMKLHVLVDIRPSLGAFVLLRQDDDTVEALSGATMQQLTALLAALGIEQKGT